MKSVYISSLLLATAAGMFAPPAAAAGSAPSVRATVFRLEISSTSAEGPFYARFMSTTSTAFDAGCGDGGYVKFDTTYMSAKNLQYAKEFIVASQLSNRTLKVATNGCIGSWAKISSIGFSDT